LGRWDDVQVFYQRVKVREGRRSVQWYMYLSEEFGVTHYGTRAVRVGFAAQNSISLLPLRQTNIFDGYRLSLVREFVGL